MKKHVGGRGWSDSSEGARGPLQQSARRRYAFRIYRWSLLVSVALGAVFGHFNLPATGAWAYLQGAVAGLLISGMIVTLEFAVFSGARRTVFEQAPFLVYFSLRSLGYTAAILAGLAASAWLLRDAASGAPLIERDSIVFSVAMSLGFNLVFGVNRLLGQGVLFKFIAGRYHRPRIEERALLFIDLESSTVIAERSGETGFLDFLNRFVADVTGPIVSQGGEIHKYVGDELIVSWPLAAGLRDARCIRACFDALAALDARAGVYEREFGHRANFRAGLHGGPVVIGELGVVKMEIAFLGDTMNTAARLLQACRDTGHRVLASAALVDRLAALPPGIARTPIGQLRLRGKQSEIMAYALTAARESVRRGR